MSDTNPWQSPGGTPSGPPTPPPPRFGEYAPPPPPQFGGYPPPAPAAPQGWAPPPKPGLIPLRPLTLGTILGASFQVMRRNPRPTFGISLLLNTGVYLLLAGVLVSFAVFTAGRIESASSADQDSIVAGSLLGGGLALLVPVIVSIVTTAVLQGIISLEVARATLGEKLTTGGLIRQAKGRVGALIGWSLLLALVITIVFAIATVIVTLLIALGGTAGIVIGVLLAIAFALAFAAGAAWIGTKVSLVPSALLIERLSLRAAVARSWTLTNRSFWRTLGIPLLVNAIISVASQVVTIPVSLIFGIVAGLAAPTGDPAASVGVLVATYAVLGIVSVVVQSIGGVMQSSTFALIYIDLRMRKEGLDLELMRYVEARQAGDATVTDPYLDTPAARQSAPTGSPWA